MKLQTLKSIIEKKKNKSEFAIITNLKTGESEIFENTLNCEYDGVLGTVAGIVGIFQANEILKKILGIGKDLNGYMLILDLLNLNFRKVKLTKFKNV